MSLERHQAVKNASAMRELIASDGWAVLDEQLRVKMDNLTSEVMLDADLADPDAIIDKIREFREVEKLSRAPSLILAGAENVLSDNEDMIEPNEPIE